MKRFGWPNVVLSVGALLILVAGALYLLPSDEYILLPSKAKPLAPLVDIKGERRDQNGGGIYYVAVDVRKASLLEEKIPGLHEGATLVPADQINPTGENDRQRRQGELRAMARSQQYAAAVALRELGYKIPIKSNGVLVEGVDEDFPAAGKLEPDDVIVSIDGVKVRNTAELTRIMRAKTPGDSVRLTVRRGDQTEEIAVDTVASPREKDRAFLGIAISDDASIVKLPVPVKIDLGNVGGPSAGLAFALDVVDELGRDVDHGKRVAATGEIALDGSVLPVGGVKQKTIGARRSGADVFLVPGENAAEARKYADGLRIIPVDSFQQALRKLATLTPNA